jgi:hypothetical protein
MGKLLCEWTRRDATSSLVWWNHIVSWRSIGAYRDAGVVCVIAISAHTRGTAIEERGVDWVTTEIRSCFPHGLECGCEHLRSIFAPVPILPSN